MLQVKPQVLAPSISIKGNCVPWEQIWRHHDPPLFNDMIGKNANEDIKITERFSYKGTSNEGEYLVKDSYELHGPGTERDPLGRGTGKHLVCQ